jgi:hypothetical protein
VEFVEAEFILDIQGKGNENGERKSQSQYIDQGKRPVSGQVPQCSLEKTPPHDAKFSQCMPNDVP